MNFNGLQKYSRQFYGKTFIIINIHKIFTHEAFGLKYNWLLYIHSYVHMYMHHNYNNCMHVFCCLHTYVTTGVSSEEPCSSTNDIINPLYHTITFHPSKKPSEEPTDDYDDVVILPEVKMTPNPAYAVPWTVINLLYIHYN